jgi:glycosyltransferase involved in cell wall biosynthesis
VRIATLANAGVIHTRRWVEYFRSRGHEVKLWSLEPGPAELDAQPLPSPPWPGFVRYPLATAALRQALARFAPDLVDAHYVPNYGLLGVLAGRHPLSVTAWGSDLLLLGRRGALQRARARFVMHRADLVLADAENLAAAARRLGAPADRVACIPWGIALERFSPRAPRQPGLILSTRMMEPVYDLTTVIEGVAPVLRSHPAAELVLAGDGSQRRELEARAAARLPSGRFRFVGRLDPDALAEWLGRADLYVSASRSDSTSLSLLEAMGSGATPVLSDTEGNREWVRDGEGGRMFALGDAAHLARALEAALADGAWRERAREHNRAVVEARADHSRNMASIEARFQSLAGRAGPR